MPEIESSEPHTARGGITARAVSLWLMGFAVVVGAIGSLISNEAVSWGFTCVFCATFLNLLTTEPGRRAAGRRRQSLQVVAGLIALAGAVIAFVASNGVPSICLGVAAVTTGLAILVPGVWPASRERFPRLFGETRWR